MLDSILKKVIEVKYNPTISEMNFQLENDWLTLTTIIVDIFLFNIDRKKKKNYLSAQKSSLAFK